MFPKKLLATAAIAASAVGFGLMGAAPVAASDVVYIGPHTCTGSSYIYSAGYSSAQTTHTHVMTNNGYVAVKTIDGYPYTYRWTYYYSGGQGTYNGHVFSNIGFVNSAYFGCDV